jgi:hypothetical protein
MILHWWSARRGFALSRSQADWQLNKVTSSEVVSLALRHGLHVLTEVRHLLLTPGMWRLPPRWLSRYDAFVRRHPALSKHGAEALLLFEKR